MTTTNKLLKLILDQQKQIEQLAKMLSYREEKKVEKNEYRFPFRFFFAASPFNDNASPVCVKLLEQKCGFKRGVIYTKKEILKKMMGSFLDSRFFSTENTTLVYSKRLDGLELAGLIKKKG